MPVIKSIERLGCNYEDILKRWRLITKQKSAAIVTVNRLLLDTRQSRSLTGTLIADFALQLLFHMAQTEKGFLCQQREESVAAARNRGSALIRRPNSGQRTFRGVCGVKERRDLHPRGGAAAAHISQNVSAVGGKDA